jgi:uncharacterized membrane protein
MVLSHVVDAWTRDADRDRTGYYWVTFLGGLAAPAFLFLAGLGSALSAASKDARGLSRADVRQALVQRGLTIFGLALVFRLQSFVLGLGAPVGLLKVDVLNVMGLALVLAALIWGAAGGAPGRVLLAAAATVGLAMAAPLVHAAAWIDVVPPPLQWYLRPAGVHTNFTLLPWTGFVCAGLATGVALTSARTPHAERRLQATLAVLAVAGTAAAYWASLQPTIYRPGQSTFWGASPTFFFLRLGLVTALLPIFRALGPAMPARLGAALATLGGASLFAYWVHVEVVYGGLAILIKRRMPLELTLVAAALVSYGLTHLIPWARAWVVTPGRRTARVRRLVARLF